MEIGRHYDRLDTFYRQVWGEHMHHGLWLTGRESLALAKAQLAERVAREVGGKRVLDIGCGYGAVGQVVAMRTGAEVTGVTNSRRQAIAQDVVGSLCETAIPEEPNPSPAVSQRRPTEVGCVEGDWLTVELGEGKFDGAYAVESLEHFADKPRFFARARHHLAAGARLIVTGWQAPRPSRLCDRICAAAHMPPLVSAEEYGRMAVAAGFEIGKVEDWSALVSPTWWHMGGVLLRRPRYWWVGLKHWRFALAALRICAAFQTGALRYAFTSFTAR